jgi:hypothetical protein
MCDSKGLTGLSQKRAVLDCPENKSQLEVFQRISRPTENHTRAKKGTQIDAITNPDQPHMLPTHSLSLLAMKTSKLHSLPLHARKKVWPMFKANICKLNSS